MTFPYYFLHWSRDDTDCITVVYFVATIVQKPTIQSVPGVLSPGVKRQGPEAHHSPPTSAKVNKIWLYTSTLQYAFMV
jgi:hypothetical protein